ncbi:MAG: VWA domain-containing protein [Blastocatellia bacterium]|nr:VWA domain-containing protein [Blastocatellia bacterium]
MRTAIATIMLVILLAATIAAQRQRTPQRPRSKPQAETQKKTAPEKNQAADEDDIPVNDETVKLGTELVNLLFSVVDRNNRIVSDVRQEEISILEDGRSQQIFTFKREATLPINIAILMDLSGSQEYTFPQERSAANEFLRSIIRPAKDSAAILTFQDDVELVQGLTSRIETLKRAFDEIEYTRRFGPTSSRKQATALYDAVYITADEILARDIREKSSSAPHSAEDSITRRAVILLTDGVDNASSRNLEEAIDRAWRSGVVIYAIGIGDRFRFEGVREGVLRRLSEETGGRAYFPHGPDDLTAGFRQIENELRSQYILAYSPTNTARDGSFRRIEVRLDSRPDLRIIHRRGYYAPAEEVKK